MKKINFCEISFSKFFLQYNPAYLPRMYILYPRNILVVQPKSYYALFNNCTSKFVLNIPRQCLCDNFIIFNIFTHNFKYCNQFRGLYIKVNISEILNFKRRIKSHLPFAGIIRSSPYSPHFQGKG